MQRLLVRFLLVVTPLAAPGWSASPARALPANFDNHVLLSGLDIPMSLAFLPDGRMLVVLKSGQILIAQPQSSPVDTATYLRIVDVNTGGERGLIDIALDPDFAGTGFFYLYYTPISSGRARISRFEHRENSGGLTSTGDLASETVLWQDTDTYISPFHYGGGLDFGPDGKLYLTLGEKAIPGIAQDLTRSGGSILRINSDGTIPVDNPFVDGIGGLEDALWASGLRNPFRARWDLPTGRFFIAEVGGNDNNLSWEDLHLATLADAKRNFGWPLCEGACDNPDFAATCDCDVHDDPIFTYPHGGVGASITGGMVYRGNQFPANPYFGAYFYGDFVRGWIRYLTFDASDTLVTGDFAFEPSAGPVIFIDQGPSGSLFYTTVAGDVRRIRFDNGNQAPIITSAQSSASLGLAPLTVTFTATTTDAEGDSLTYQWLFGDSTSATGTVIGGVVPPEVHSYTTNGVFSAQLAVSDSSHITLSSPIQIRVGTPPTVAILTPLDMALFRAGDVIDFSATASDSDGAIGPTDFKWNIRFKHNQHFHPAVDDFIGNPGSFAIPMNGHDFSSATGYVIDVLVTDVDGLTAADTVEVLPDKVVITFETIPSGLTIFIDDIPHTTPHFFDTLIDFEHTISAPLTQCVDSTGRQFIAWSDSGSATHLFTVPDFSQLLTASYLSGGECFNPTTIGLVMRLIAEDRVATNDTTVIFWEDLTPFGNDLFHVNGNPSLQPGVVNGHSIIQLDTRDDALGRAGINGLPTGGADRSIFMVVRYGPDGSGGLLYGTDECNQAFGLNVFERDRRLAVQGRCPANNFPANVLATNAGWISHSVTLRSDTLSHYRDGILIGTDVHSFLTGTDVIILNAELDDDPDVDMEVAELLIYDRAVSEAERQEIESYFQARYLGPLLAEIAITSPSANDTIPGQIATISWQASGDLSQADHVDLSLDGGPELPFTPLTGAHQFSTLAPGSHTLVVTLSSASHTPLAADTLILVMGITGGLCDLLTEGLVLHLESDNGVFTFGSQVGFWFDQSTRGNDFSAAGDPLFISSTGPNGRPFIRFDGFEDKLERLSPLNGFPSGSMQRTVFLVARYFDEELGGFVYGRDAANQAFGLVTKAGKLTLTGSGGGFDFPSSESGFGAGWLSQSVVLDDALHRQYKNGVLIESNTNIFVTTLVSALIGEPISGPPQIEMDAAAILVYDRALSEPERVQVEAYLQEKYFGVACASPNVSPIAVADTTAIPVGGTAVIAVLDNDSDPDGFLDPAGVALTALPANGAVVGIIAATGNLVYQHDGSPTAIDSLVYTVTDNLGAVSNPATVHIDVITGGNLPPTALTDSSLVTVGDSTVIDVLANDSDADGSLDATSVLIVDSPLHGGLSVHPVTGNITYSHDGSGAERDTFTYVVKDDAGAWSNLASVIVIARSVVEVSDSATPGRFALYQNSPNPLRNRTVFRFDLPLSTEVQLRIYDVRGRVVRNAISGIPMAAGRHRWMWDGKDDSGAVLASGIYFYRLQTPQFTSSKKAVIRE